MAARFFPKHVKPCLLIYVQKSSFSFPCLLLWASRSLISWRTSGTWVMVLFPSCLLSYRNRIGGCGKSLPLLPWKNWLQVELLILYILSHQLSPLLYFWSDTKEELYFSKIFQADKRGNYNSNKVYTFENGWNCGGIYENMPTWMHQICSSWCFYCIRINTKWTEERKHSSHSWQGCGEENKISTCNKRIHPDRTFLDLLHKWFQSRQSNKKFPVMKK